MSKMKLYRDFKTSMICLSRESGVEISRHASDIRKICQYQSFYKDNGKWWATTKLIMLWSGTILKGLTISYLNT